MKITTALVAAFLITSVSGALAFDGPSTMEEWNYARNSNAPVPHYAVQNRAAAAVQGQLIEGRNVGNTRRAYSAPRVLDRDEAINNIGGAN
jgi:hypothetical protein